MKILLTGKNGQVGSELSRALAPLGEVVAFDRAGLDLTLPDQIVAAVRSVRPDVLVNAAAYTAVDQAESEPDVAHAINAAAVGVLAEEANVPVRTVHGWIREARRRGFLPPGKQGRP